MVLAFHPSDVLRRAMNLSDLNTLRHARQVLCDVYDYACRKNVVHKDECYTEMQDAADKLLLLIDGQLAEMQSELGPSAPVEPPPRHKPKRDKPGSTPDLF